MPDRQTLTESVAFTEARSTGDGSFEILLITPGWGSSGYYSPKVIESAGNDRIFPAGLHMYLDHPTEAEDEQRPERSVKDLAAVLTEDATWNGEGLVAKAKAFGPHREVLAEMADAIGVSVRAYAEVSHGEAEGRRGHIIERLDEGISADFVTHAGRGGRILEVLESARQKLSEAVSNTAWSSFSASDYSLEQWRRACLISPDSPSENKGDYKLPYKEPNGQVNRNGVHAAASVLAGGRGGVQASAAQKKAAARKLVSLYRNQLDEDPPESLTRLASSGEAAVDVFAREAALAAVREARNIGQWIESRLHLALTQIGDEMFGEGRVSRDERIALSSAVGDGLTAFTKSLEKGAPQLYERDLWDDPDAMAATAEEAATENDPVDPAGQQEETIPESRKDTNMPEIEEARLRQLEADAGRVQTLEAERDSERQRADTAERDLAEERARTYARDFGNRRVREANSELPGSVVDRIVAEAMRTIPLGEDMRLDADVFGRQVDEARQAEETYLAGLQETVGRVRGLGQNEPPQISEADVDNLVAGAFGRRVAKGA